MSNPEFEPKIGKPRWGREIKSDRLTRMVVKETTRHRASKSPSANALTRRPVAELGRGKGAPYGLTPPPPGWRRVIVKARIARHGASDLAAARPHQHSIMRDGVMTGAHVDGVDGVGDAFQRGVEGLLTLLH